MTLPPNHRSIVSSCASTTLLQFTCAGHQTRACGRRTLHARRTSATLQSPDRTSNLPSPSAKVQLTALRTPVHTCSPDRLRRRTMRLRDSHVSSQSTQRRACTGCIPAAAHLPPVARPPPATRPPPLLHARRLTRTRRRVATRSCTAPAHQRHYQSPDRTSNLPSPSANLQCTLPTPVYSPSKSSSSQPVGGFPSRPEGCSPLLAMCCSDLCSPICAVTPAPTDAYSANHVTASPVVHSTLLTALNIQLITGRRTPIQT